MGNKLTLTFEKPNKKIYTDTFTSINNDEIKRIKENYKIIIENPEKTEIVNDILDYYLSRNDKYIYQKKTDILCNEKERICMCNIYAEDYRKILEGINYRKDEKYISWFRGINDHF